MKPVYAAAIGIAGILIGVTLGIEGLAELRLDPPSHSKLGGGALFFFVGIMFLINRKNIKRP